MCLLNDSRCFWDVGQGVRTSVLVTSCSPFSWAPLGPDLGRGDAWGRRDMGTEALMEVAEVHVASNSITSEEEGGNLVVIKWPIQY